MIRAFKVLSREEVEAYEPPEGAIVISICSPGMPPARLHERFEGRTLTLYFHDVDRPMAGVYESCSEQHAARVAEFIDQHRHDAVELVVHCEAGISRSPGMLLAVIQALYPSANTLVRRVVKDTLMKRWWPRA